MDVIEMQSKLLKCSLRFDSVWVGLIWPGLHCIYLYVMQSNKFESER